ncbi:MAG: copper amine oxidase N-terminal domain-containing protein, partial [Syntrophomonadaceae bacterium]|nr:copper amine oxidase N-terminal domain-containing protein [Syntrophomonadaceae bacterium]
MTVRGKPGSLLVLAVLVLAVLAAPTSASTQPSVRVTVDGELLQLDQQPLVVDGRTLVPARPLLEALGAEVEWNGPTQTVTAITDRHRLVLRVGFDTASVDGRPVTVYPPPVLVNGRVLLPLRFAAQALGASVAWDAATRTAIITSAPATPGMMWTPWQLLRGARERGQTLAWVVLAAGTLGACLAVGAAAAALLC